jgi:hypothetical protein
MGNKENEPFELASLLTVFHHPANLLDSRTEEKLEKGIARIPLFIIWLQIEEFFPNSRQHVLARSWSYFHSFGLQYRGN